MSDKDATKHDPNLAYCPCESCMADGDQLELHQMRHPHESEIASLRTELAKSLEAYDRVVTEHHEWDKKRAEEMQSIRLELAGVQTELDAWTKQIRPSEELLQAFADQIHMMYVQFASDKGTYQHRMDVIKSAMLTYCKALIIEKGHIIQREKELLRAIVAASPYVRSGSAADELIKSVLLATRRGNELGSVEG